MPPARSLASTVRLKVKVWSTGDLSISAGDPAGRAGVTDKISTPVEINIIKY